MTTRPVKTFFPQTRLSQVATSPGGIARDEAIAGALKSVESMRQQGDAEILRVMALIDQIVAGAGRVGLGAASLRAILLHADQIVTLAGTFGYDALDKVMRSMCDVADGLLHAGLSDVAPVAVHAQSMRLMAPGASSLSDVETARVLAGLAKILKHYNFVSLAGDEAAG